MSNFLFQNIGVVFGAPSAVTEIISKLTPAQEEKKKNEPNPLKNASDLSVDENGEVDISNEIVIGKTQDLFGEKIYEDLYSDIGPSLDTIKESKTDYGRIKESTEKSVEKVKDALVNKVLEPAMENYDVKRGTQNRLKKELTKEIDSAFSQITGDFDQQVNIARTEHEKQISTAETEKDADRADESYKTAMEEAMKSFTESVEKEVYETVQKKPQEIVEKLEKNKAENKKKTIEDDVRARLRGFSRTIPSFLMAYGDENLTLKNLDDYTEDDVFLEVTGITEDDFRFLRDVGEYTDENGEKQYFKGNLFDETVFNDSVREFLKKRRELANYFDESKTEDIFDYIPPQKTNQIFAPKWVVKKMVDELEEENPGCFDDPDHTFADLYMKSGLYITEIVKRLYRSEKMKKIFPDDGERIRHILRKQVYGMAPSRIIYLISTNYILGFDETLKRETKNFVQADAAEASKNGTLEELSE